MASVNYIQHKAIDKVKWDDCIRSSSNSLIYGYSFYLDCMADNWDGLVLGDYEAVMPLPWRKKLGIRYVYQPFLVAQAGIFATDVNSINAAKFVEAIPGKFRLVEIPLNTGNSVNNIERATTLRSNYVLSLNRDYDDIFNTYKSNTRRNLSKAMQSGCTFTRLDDVGQLIALAAGQMQVQGMEISRNIARFRNLYDLLSKNEEAACFAVHSPQNRLLSACCFFIKENRAYYILVGNAPEARETGASHMLIDHFIREYAGREMVLDFEGSDIPGLAFFYSGFGAEHETYPALNINRLPWFIRLLRK